MNQPAFALYAVCLLLAKMADVSSTLRFLPVKVGNNVTLECFYQDIAAPMIYWYKQTLGQELKVVSQLYKYDQRGRLSAEFKDKKRFSMLVAGTGIIHLRISDVQLSDSATYYCVRGYSYMFEFEEGLTVSVEGSGVNVQSLVHQASSENIQPGGSVTLSCTVHTGTCDGEHSLYWFKNSGEHQPGLLYTHGDKRDQCERKPDTQTHTCVYNLSLRSLNYSDARTYYCAVASCGHILFGNGTELDHKGEVDSHTLVNFLSGALAVTSCLVVFLACVACSVCKTNSCQCTDSQERPAAAPAPHMEFHQDADNLYYAAFKDQTASRSRKLSDDTMTECVYTAVKQSS